MRLALIIFAVASAAGCKPSDTSELEADTKALRAEMREVQKELRALEKETIELRRKIDLGGAATVAAAPSADAGPKIEQDGELPDPVAPPPRQANVKIAIESNPTGATVFIDDRKLGMTPLIFEHQPGTTQLMLRIDKPGYRPRLMSIRPDEDAKIQVQLARQ